MDYISQMLRLYFYENNYTKEQIEQLLEDNPFGEDFAKWEEMKKYENRIFAKFLKKSCIINSGTPIQEIVLHKDNSIGNYLENEIMYSEYNLKDDLSKIRLNKNRILLLKGYYPPEINLLTKIRDNSMEFITGICTDDENYYSTVLDDYRKMLFELKIGRFIRKQYGNEKILIYTNKSK